VEKVRLQSLSFQDSLMARATKQASQMLPLIQFLPNDRFGRFPSWLAAASQRAESGHSFFSASYVLSPQILRFNLADNGQNLVRQRPLNCPSDQNGANHLYKLPDRIRTR